MELNKIGLDSIKLRSYALRTYNDPRYVFSMNWSDGLNLVISDIDREINEKVNDTRDGMYQKLYCWMIKKELEYFSFDRFVEFLETGRPLYGNDVVHVDNKKLSNEEIKNNLDKLIENTVWKE